MSAVAEAPAEGAAGAEVADGDVPVGAAGYRPHLDGLRTLAVYLVVAFHAGADRAAGGFIGVDVFFVLSGYLVTGLLLRDLKAVGGVRLSRFYSRRFRRLLPAAFVTLLVTGAVYTAVASPIDAAEALRSIKAAFLYVANWFFIRESSDYFAADVESSPVVHFWSLAIEEQFYLVWPLALGALYAATRRIVRVRWQAIRAIVVVAGIASALAALAISRTDLSRAYYGTDTRAYQLLAGAFIALTPALVGIAARYRRSVQVVALLGLAALVVLGSSLIEVNAIRRGLLVTVVTCGLLVALEASAQGLGRRVLSIAPLTYLGRISYGTYLWHWPIIVVVTQVIDISPTSLFLLTCLAATGIASLSYQVLESPVRASDLLDRYRRPVIASGLALSVLGAFVLAPAVVDRELDQGGSAAVADQFEGGAAPVPSDIDWDAVLHDRPGPPGCEDEDPTECIVVAGDGQRILLAGDSHAAMFLPTLSAIAEARGDELAVAIRNTCPWQQSLTFGPLEKQDCLAAKADFRDRVIPALDPDVVVLAGRTFDDPTNTVTLETPDGTRVRDGDPGYEEVVRRATEETVEGFRADGREVVIVEPIPYPRGEDDPLRCLAGAEFLEQCRYIASPGPLPSEVIYRDLAASDDGVWTLDLDGLVCPYLPICDPMVEGMVVKHDEGHLTATYARSLSGQVGDLLVDDGILA